MSRDILAPPLQRMSNNRCYRVNTVHEDFGGHPAMNAKRGRHPTGEKGYMEPDLYAEDDDDGGGGDDESSYTLEELATGHQKLTMHVAQPFYGGLIGFKGATKRRIESETQTEIHVPRGREGGNFKHEDVTIKGKTVSSVCTARRKIQLLVASLRKRMRPTHFLCVALNTGEVKERFMAFKNTILAENFAGIDELLFQSESCIHLTLGVCVLLDDAERAKAVELLQSCRSMLTDLQTPFEVRLKGLEIMNDDPSAVRILYACVVAPELQRFADRALKHFLASGLSQEERDTVKLHMTLMNSKFRKSKSEAAADTFDARDILKRFADFNFGAATCSAVQLCVLSSSSAEKNDFYKITGALEF